MRQYACGREGDRLVMARAAAPAVPLLFLHPDRLNQRRQRSRVAKERQARPQAPRLAAGGDQPRVPALGAALAHGHPAFLGAYQAWALARGRENRNTALFQRMSVCMHARADPMLNQCLCLRFFQGPTTADMVEQY